MFEAQDTTTREIYAFRSLDTLTRRLGGTDWTVEHSQAFRPPTRRVNILKWDQKVHASHVLAVVSVPTEAVEAAAAESSA